MDCVVCQRRSGYNRVVVDAESGVELGGLCVDCERDAFGKLADELGDPTDDTCVCCDRDGFWRLPKWLPSTYETDGKTVSYVDYDPADTALKLCDEHLASIGVEDISRPAADPGRGEYVSRSVDD
ncbi:MAG: hypothetical protein ABEH83_03885 [Halobacterium sp.]